MYAANILGRLFLENVSRPNVPKLSSNDIATRVRSYTFFATYKILFEDIAQSH